MVFIALIAIILLIAADQFIKFWAIENLANATMPVHFIKFGNTEVINLSYYENTGAAFSIFRDKILFLIIITSIFLLIGVYLLVSKKVSKKFMVISFALIIAGGAGNLIDRIFRGYVVDYIEVRLFNFAVFNFADSCVVIGAIMLLIYMLFFDKPKKESLNG